MSRAFTLIELLVVIAIIAILAAILFPVFAQAKLAAKKTVSLSNEKQISTALVMYTADADGFYPRTHSDSPDNELPGVITWFALNNYQAAMEPYILQQKGGVDTSGRINGRATVWYDPADPDTSVPYYWGSYMDNGLITGLFTNESEVAAPAETVFNFVHERAWDKVNGVTIPSNPGQDDPFWASEYFDMCLDTWSNSDDPAALYHWKKKLASPPCRLFPNDSDCRDWTQQIDGYSTILSPNNGPRYGKGVPFAFSDGHVRFMPFEATYRSVADNMWDLR